MGSKFMTYISPERPKALVKAVRRVPPCTPGSQSGKSSWDNRTPDSTTRGLSGKRSSRGGRFPASTCSSSGSSCASCARVRPPNTISVMTAMKKLRDLCMFTLLLVRKRTPSWLLASQVEHREPASARDWCEPYIVFNSFRAELLGKRFTKFARRSANKPLCCGSFRALRISPGSVNKSINCSRCSPSWCSMYL